MKNKEYEFYEKRKNWDFSHLKITKESLTDWEMASELRKIANKETVALDLGTGGGENVIKYYPPVKEILATDFSPAMIETAEANLRNSGRTDITFKVMDNLNMEVPKNYFDVVTARHTLTDPKQIYACLKSGGYLIVRGVDMFDCWQLKRMFGRGQGYQDVKPISLVDYEAILDAGFKDVELIPLHIREYYQTKEDLYGLLIKVPIIENFSFNYAHDEEAFNQYVKENTTEKGIILIRRYYGITAKKR